MKILGLSLLIIASTNLPYSEPIKERWQFFPCSMGDNQAFIYLNLGAKDAVLRLPQNLAKLKLKYKSPKDNGLPTAEEYTPVKLIEDRIDEHSKKTESVYVGRVTVAGYRFFYVYTNRKEEDWLSFIDQLQDDAKYEILLS